MVVLYKKIKNALSEQPVSNMLSRKEESKPIVFVHGLGGWGEGSKLDRIFPHWGLMAGSIKKHLAEQGFAAYAASVSPASSTWDRTCELYAHLTGTRVDYGEAHSKAHSHERFGPTYEKLGPDWPNQSIHLISHSFGGATIRLFAQLCAEGSAEECDATPPEDLSPLFRGTLGGNIVSITTLAAPHNGSTAMLPPVKGAGIGILEAFVYSLMMANALIPGFQEFFPCYLEQYGLKDCSGIKETLKQVLAFGKNHDNSGYDLDISGAAKLNRRIKCQPNIYYFSYAGDVTHESRSGHRLPNVGGISLMTAEPALRMAKKQLLSATPVGNILDDSWLSNDGQVNTVSALHPFDEPYQDYNPATVVPGVWQVMPVMKSWDHYDFAGSFRLGGKKGIKEFYLAIAQMLEML